MKALTEMRFSFVDPGKEFSTASEGQVFDNFSQGARQTFQECSLMADDFEIMGSVISKGLEAESEVCGNTDLILPAYRFPFIISKGEGSVVTYEDDEHSRNDVSPAFDNFFHYTEQFLVDNEVVETLWDRNDLLMLDGIRLVYEHTSLHLPFDPGESVSPSILFESLNIHFDIPHCFPIALCSAVVGLDGTTEGGKLSNEMSSCTMDVQAVQPRPPQPLPKPHFLALLLDFLAQVAHSVEIGRYGSKMNARLLAANFLSKMQPAIAALAAMLQECKALELRSGPKVKVQTVHPVGYTFYGVIEMVELAAHHKLHHGLDDALVYVILLNKFVVVGQVITELNVIRLKFFTVTKKEPGCNWLIAVTMARFDRERASKTVHQCFKLDNFSFGGSKHEYGLYHISCEHVKEYGLNHISSPSGAPFADIALDEIFGIQISESITYILTYHVTFSFDKEENDSTGTTKDLIWAAISMVKANTIILPLSLGIDIEERGSKNGIADTVSCELLLESITNVPHVAEKVHATTNSVAKLRQMTYGSLSDTIRCSALLDTSQIVTLLCHGIWNTFIFLLKLSNKDEPKSKLQATNQIMILLLKLFAYRSPGVYNTLNCPTRFSFLNLESGQGSF
ncbi:uncharacterized protein LOC107781077 isoform X1 [Nicotiana tabacum]|uniref:Uncharacterized protein LOC107781077 isoform X1 n=3 Tax=Nicotiana tabacum TaxID=4097 RepID=A0AC58U8U3_TOBAC|nr:PREDICTED: uncharacterized protein LOC107781077 isoform X1 [Nicotiana tabacum]